MPLRRENRTCDTWPACDARNTTCWLTADETFRCLCAACFEIRYGHGPEETS